MVPGMLGSSFLRYSVVPAPKLSPSHRASPLFGTRCRARGDVYHTSDAWFVVARLSNCEPMASISTEKKGRHVETIDWKDGEYNASHHASNVGVKIRHVFNRQKRIWEGYQVRTRGTSGCWQWD